MNNIPSLEQTMERRVQVKLPGRFMIADGQEFACEASEISLEAVSFNSERPVPRGSHIVAYVDELGRIEGSVTDTTNNGFVIDINATTHRKEKLAAKLTWILNRHHLGLEDERTQKRILPDDPDIEMQLDNGEVYKCRLVDLSVDGAAFVIDSDIRPAVGSHVTLGKVSAHVVRHFDEGIAVKFAKPNRSIRSRIDGTHAHTERSLVSSTTM